MGKKVGVSPVREYKTIIQDSGDTGYINRILVGHPVTGLLRFEWVIARYHQVTPVNWSQVEHAELIPVYPYRYSVMDAQNIIVQRAINMDFEWMLLWEHDVIAPAGALMKLNDYIREEKVPIVSGLYYTRARPSQPLIFRGRGNSFYDKWEMGDQVWCDGVPTGFLLIHMGVIREMYKDAPEYKAKDMVVRKVFETPRGVWYDEKRHQFNSMSGTSDLHWCTKVIEGKYLAKAGWKKVARKRYPFLVDTTLFCNHINPDGEMFP